MRADARRNRARILELAAHSFGEEGLSLSLDEIARRADVGPGTVHRHFPTKEGLLDAVVLSQVEALALSARALRRTRARPSSTSASTSPNGARRTARWRRPWPR